MGSLFFCFEVFVLVKVIATFFVRVNATDGVAFGNSRTVIYFLQFYIICTIIYLIKLQI